MCTVLNVAHLKRTTQIETAHVPRSPGPGDGGTAAAVAASVSAYENWAACNRKTFPHSLPSQISPPPGTPPFTARISFTIHKNTDPGVGHVNLLGSLCACSPSSDQVIWPPPSPLRPPVNTASRHSIHPVHSAAVSPPHVVRPSIKRSVPPKFGLLPICFCCGFFSGGLRPVIPPCNGAVDVNGHKMNE